MNDKLNTSYIFIPFILNAHSYSELINALNDSSSWKVIHDEIVYMLKFVADKFNSKNAANCQCFHYRVSSSKFKELIGEEGATYCTKEHEFFNEKVKFDFLIEDIQLYCFSTSVNILAIRIAFNDSNPMYVSAALYNLKKVSREKIFYRGKEITILEIAKNAMEEYDSIFHFEFFYYANASTERANVLTYLEVEPQDSYKKELFYLRRCYNEGFLYAENDKLDSDEIFIPSKDTVWGLSPEAAICLACPGFGRGEFILGTFFKNFNAQYLFMYVLLLHQKYVLYMFLMKIGIGAYNSLEKLEQYQSDLYEFETDFVFSLVTEVPQYQYLYDKMTHAFALKKMYEDVHEPLVSLAETRRLASENEQKVRDDTVNKSLLILSLLSFFSALIDSFDFVNSFFGLFASESVIHVIQVLCIIAIFIALFFVIDNLKRSGKYK